MPLRNQPYLPLYVQDFMTDEKLAECSAESTGVYIRLMCLLHKQENYGKILLKQKYKQTDQQIKNFAAMLAKHMPYDLLVIEKSLIELLEEDVIQLEGDTLSQKRMVKDSNLSDKRALAGSGGGKTTSKKHFAVAKNEANDTANTVANSENESESENENDFDLFKEVVSLYNDICVSLPKVQTINDSRKKVIKARYKDFKEDINIFKDIFIMAEKSKFLTGQVKNFRASFDFLLSPTNYPKVLEGNYENNEEKNNLKAGQTNKPNVKEFI